MNKEQIIEDKKTLKPMIVLFKAYQSLIKVVKKDIKQYGFDLNEFAVLEVLYHHRKLSVQEINEKILVVSSSLSYILNKLETKKLIQRQVSKTDRRVSFIELTNNGLEEANDIFPKHYNLLKEIFVDFSDSDKEFLIANLKQIGLKAESIEEGL